MSKICMQNLYHKGTKIQFKLTFGCCFAGSDDIVVAIIGGKGRGAQGGKNNESLHDP